MFTPHFQFEDVPEGDIKPRHFMLQQIKYTGLFHLSKKQVTKNSLMRFPVLFYLTMLEDYKYKFPVKEVRTLKQNICFEN